MSGNRVKLIEVVQKEGIHNVIIVPNKGKGKFAFRSAHRDQALNVAKAYAKQYRVLIHYSDDTRIFVETDTPDGTPDGDQPIEG